VNSLQEKLVNHTGDESAVLFLFAISLICALFEHKFTAAIDVEKIVVCQVARYRPLEVVPVGSAGGRKDPHHQKWSILQMDDGGALTESVEADVGDEVRRYIHV
jgi:hypothetical protein